MPEKPDLTHLAPSATSSDEQQGVAAAWQVARKNWRTTTFTALAVVLAVTFFTLGQKKIYQATATVEFDPTPPRPLGKDIETVVDMGAGNYWNNREYYETQYQVIQSMRVALAVVRDLDLDHDAGFLANAPPGARASSGRPTPEETAETLRDRLTVDPIKESRLAVVRFQDADPQRAQRVLSAIVNTYVEQNLDDALSSTSAAVDWLRSQLDTLKKDLESSEMSLHDYKLNKNILSVDIDGQSNMLREEMKQLNDALTSVRTRREELAARHAELLKVKTDSPTDLPASELLQSVLLQGLRQRYADAVRDRDALLGEGKGANHPDVAAATARIAASRDALLAEVKNIEGAVARDLDVARRQEAGLSGLFERAKRQALDLNLLEIEYNRLRRTKDNTEKLYSLVLERTKESDLARMMRVNNIHVIDQPLLPLRPVRPRVPLNIALGLVLGIGLGVLAAFARALLDRSVKTPDDVESQLRLACLGILPALASGADATPYRRRRTRRGAPNRATKPELIVHDLPSSGVAEAARAIRTNLMFMSPDNPPKTVLVTSAAASEGKTTVACCIAIAMAQTGQRVALVDCDLRRPRLHRVFDRATDAGVTTYLLDEYGFDAASLESDVAGLSVVTAGPVPPNPAELLLSERFRSLVHRLASRFDRVIIDSPPVLPVTDAAVLSTLVDVCVLVVRAFATTKDMARHGARILTDVAGRPPCVVLNAVDLHRAEYRHGYYYYGYRQGYSSSEAHPQEVASPAAPPGSP